MYYAKRRKRAACLIWHVSGTGQGTAFGNVAVHPDELTSMQPSLSSMHCSKSAPERRFVRSATTLFPSCCPQPFLACEERERGGSPRCGARCHHPRFFVSFRGPSGRAIGLSRAWGLRLFPGAKRLPHFYYQAHSAFSLITWPASPKISA